VRQFTDAHSRVCHLLSSPFAGRASGLFFERPRTAIRQNGFWPAPE
jgi:hypothetical protein